MRKNRYLLFNLLFTFVFIFNMITPSLVYAGADKTPPTILNVTSSKIDGTYGIDTIIPIQIVFSEAVSITGSPLLAVNTGTNAAYDSGSGTTTITFNYVVSSGQSISDLNYIATTSLNLNGGTIKDLAGNALATGLPDPALAGSLGTNKNIVINTTQPTITNITSSASDGTYGTDAVIPINITFSSNVSVTGNPKLSLNSNGTAIYSSGSGSNTLIFNYTVQSGNNSSDLNYNDVNSLTLNGGSIRDGYGNPPVFTLPALSSANSLGTNKNIVVSTIQSTITNISTTNTDGIYKTGDMISIQINFDKNVNAIGSPQLTLNSGGTANYSSGSGSSSLIFSYTVKSGENSKSLNYMDINSLSLNGGTIKDSLGNSINLVLPNISSNNALSYGKSIIIDTTNSFITKVISSNSSGAYTTGDTLQIQVCFNEDVFVTGNPKITLNSGGTAIYNSGSGSNTLIFNYSIQNGETINGLNQSSVNAFSLNGGTVRDVIGRDSTLILPSLTSNLSLLGNKYFTINFTQPVVTNVTTSNADGHYGQLIKILVQVVFSKPVTVTGSPQLSFNTGRTISYTTGSGTNTLTFVYAIANTDTQTLLNYSNTTALTLNGGTIQDASANNAIITLPSLTSQFSLAGNKKIYIDTKITKTLWTIGSSGTDTSYNMSKTNDGGYALSGFTSSTTGDFAGVTYHSGTDAFIRKYNASNVVEWTKDYGGSGYETSRAVIQTSDGGYLLIGDTTSLDGIFAGLNKGGQDIYLIKTTSDGTVSWAKNYGGTSTEYSLNVMQTSDGGYMIFGNENSTDGDFAGKNKGSQDAFVIKTNSIGEKQWVKTYGGSASEDIGSITIDNNGGYIMTGYSYSHDGDFASLTTPSTAILMRIDGDGNITWVRSLHGSGWDGYNSSIINSKGNIVATGYTNSTDGDFVGINKGDYDAIIAEYDINGNLLWRKNYGGTGMDDFDAIIQSSDGDYVLTGYMNTTDGDFGARTAQGLYDLIVAKVSSSDGTLLWFNTIGGSADDKSVSLSSVELSNGNYMGTGFSSSTNGDFTGLNKGVQDVALFRHAEAKTDVTPPNSPSINLSSYGWILASNNFTITNGTDSGVGIKKSQYKIDGGSWIDYSSQVTVSTTGWHVIEAQTIDNNNNVSSTTTQTFGIDITSDVPTISASPISQPTWTNSLNITLNFTDALSGTAKRYYKWDIDSTIEDNNWMNFNDMVIPAQLGEHYLQAKCIDNVGNVTTQSFGPYKFDNQAPNVTISPNGYDWIKINPSITLSYTDALSGINNVYYKIDTDNIIEDNNWISYSGSISDTVQGISYIQVKVVDNAGNVTMQSSNACKYDSIAPILTVTEPNLDWVTSPINISITANDVASDIASLQYKYDTDNIIEDNNWTDYSGSITDNTEGIRYLHVKAVDNAGNITMQNYGPYKYDNSTPSITVNPSNLDWSKTPINISALYNDTVSGISSIYYKFDTDNIIDDDNWTVYSGDVLDNIEGTRYFHVKAIDNAGNIAMQNFGTYSFDNTIPLKPTIDYDTNSKTVTISNIQDSVSSPIAYYTINNGTPIEYTTPFMVDYSCTIDAYTLDSAGNKSDIATYSITIDGQIFTVSLDKNEISFSSVTPSNSEYEVKNALKSTIASSSAYKIELKTIDNFKSASNNSVSSDNLSFKLSTDGVYSSMQNNIDVLLGSNESSPSGKDFYIDSKLHTEWNAIPDIYTTQIKFIVTITP